MKNRPCTSNGIKLSLHPVNSDLGFNWFFNAKLRIDMKKYIKPTIKTCRLIDTLGYALSGGINISVDKGINDDEEEI